MELIAMGAVAWGAMHHDKDHTLVTGADFCREDMAANGSVSITFKTENPFGLNGAYYVKLTFTAAEIDKMHRLSFASTIKGLTERLETKPAETFVR
ncbi:MAG: hypothetical protein ACLP4V_01520 [Methylocella sp.]